MNIKILNSENKIKIASLSNIFKASNFNRGGLYLWIAIALAGMTLLQLIGLKNLEYTTSQLETVPPEAAEQPPTFGNFQMGSIEWDVDLYARSPKLKVFREYFRAYCERKLGLSAALCVSNKLAEQIPFGNPTNEFLASNFNPSASFKKHLNGMPGHCVTLSGFLAATLLSVGIPARVVQLVPQYKPGHNVVEVWDRDRGWLLIDTTYGGLIGNPHGLISAVEAWRSPNSVRWIGKGKASAPRKYNPVVLYEDEEAPLLRGHLIYPEPWLYLRIGHRVSSWPWRGQFVHIGPWQWEFGLAQILLRWGIAICSLFTLVCICAGISSLLFCFTGKLKQPDPLIETTE